jgi:stage II sporulation protein AB (anti-sigma F factor)
MRCSISGSELTVEIEDKGVGIDNIAKAMEPLYTTRPELERSGMGFSFMEAFMDELEVESTVGKGTTVTMKKSIGKKDLLKGYTQEAKQKVF